MMPPDQKLRKTKTQDGLLMLIIWDLVLVIPVFFFPMGIAGGSWYFFFGFFMICCIIGFLPLILFIAALMTLQEGKSEFSQEHERAVSNSLWCFVGSILVVAALTPPVLHPGAG